jgi:hypothetical protein
MSQRPRPPIDPGAGSARPASGSRSAPASAISQTALPSAAHDLSTPRPPPWRMLLTAASCIASARSAAREPCTPWATAQIATPRRMVARSSKPNGCSIALADRVDTVVAAAWLTPAALDVVRMALARRGHDVRRQAGLVIGADQRKRAGVCEREVEQRLVPLALGDLLRRALRPDRLADPVQPLAAAGVPVDEVAPHGDDAGRIAPCGLHVDELDASRGVAEPAAQRLLAGRQHGDEHGLVALDGGHDERQYGLGESLRAAIEDRVVTKGRGPLGGKWGFGDVGVRQVVCRPCSSESNSRPPSTPHRHASIGSRNGSSGEETMRLRASGIWCDALSRMCIR